MQTSVKEDLIQASEMSNVIVVYNFEGGEKPSDKSVFTFNTDKKPDLNLTKREKEVLKLVAEGETNAQIADKLFISIHTAKAHVCNIMQKLGVSDRVKAAVFAIRLNLV